MRILRSVCRLEASFRRAGDDSSVCRLDGSFRRAGEDIRVRLLVG